MPKVTEQYKIDRRAQISTAAAECFARRGVHQTSMADIIAASGLSAGAIYNHFKSKQEITVSVASTLIRARLLEVLAEATDPASPPISPGDLLALTLRTITADEQVSRLALQLWADAAIDDELLALMQLQVVEMRKILITPINRWGREVKGLSRARAATWAHQTAQLNLGLAMGFMVQLRLIPDFDPEAYIAHARNLMGDGPEPLNRRSSTSGTRGRQR